MQTLIKDYVLSFTIIMAITALTVDASEANEALIQEYKRTANTSFSAKEGEKLWTKISNNRSCTTCHSKSVNDFGKHNRTGKIIKPMSPTANPERLTDSKKIKKWLLRNCKWTFGRECTALEKGNILLWLSQQ